MRNDTLDLTPSPADPRPVKVFMLDDCTWWAGYSLQQCIDHARAQGIGDFEDAERLGYALSDDHMELLTFRDDSEILSSFAGELQRRISAGEQFPQLFASTEY